MTSAWAVSGPSATAPRASMESSPDGVDPVPSLTSVCSTAATAHPHLLHSFVSGLLPFLFKKMKPGQERRLISSEHWLFLAGTFCLYSEHACSYACRFSSQHPPGGPQLSITPFSGTLRHSGFCGHRVCMWCTHLTADRALTVYTRINKSLNRTERKPSPARDVGQRQSGLCTTLVPLHLQCC